MQITLYEISYANAHQYYYLQLTTDGVVLPSIVQEYYLMKKLFTRLGNILMDEAELGVALQPSFTDPVLEMYELSYKIITTIRKIVSILASMIVFCMSCTFTVSGITKSC